MILDFFSKKRLLVTVSIIPCYENEVNGFLGSYLDCDFVLFMELEPLNTNSAIIFFFFSNKMWIWGFVTGMGGH